jgi:outer membrane protein OmpA-like peptidoglycan-associated protein
MMGASMMGIGCGAKQPSVALESARTAYTQAEQKPQVAANAPTALREAQQALNRAETAWEKDRDETEISHLAYLTEQRVEIAEAIAERELADADRETLSQEREAILREARAREAEQARIEAERTQREAELALVDRQAAAVQIDTLKQQLGALQAKTTTTESGTILTLDSVLFETNKAALKSGALQNLYPLVTFLRENPERTIKIEGHTDSTGDENYNFELSQQRAESVREFLTQNGIEPNRIIARGYGETSPVAPNDTAAGRQQNRRVDLVFPN